MVYFNTILIQIDGIQITSEGWFNITCLIHAGYVLVIVATYVGIVIGTAIITRDKKEKTLEFTNILWVDTMITINFLFGYAFMTNICIMVLL